ncbi:MULTISPECIES: hypothetical protein [Lentzea]|uniref:Uncharacterized protein n=1 Tax=Lentzea sokolovensis TaxID=3095429 RepID=A0ABU4V885_9PSEU|nr:MULTISPECIES: hypothetical protein [Lentzea]MDX8148017.1 hypothetical protein [Lentzea sp. BCCO 10_0061]
MTTEAEPWAPQGCTLPTEERALRVADVFEALAAPVEGMSS